MFRISLLSLTVFLVVAACQGRPELPASVAATGKYSGDATNSVAGQTPPVTDTGDAEGGTAAGTVTTPTAATPVDPLLALNEAVDLYVPPSYDGDLKALLDANCTTCHNPAKLNGKVDLTGIDNAKASAAKISAIIRSGDMPPGDPTARSAAKQASLDMTANVAEAWAKAPSNFAATLKDIKDITFVAAIEPLNSKLCGTCHSEAVKKGGVVLVSEDDLKAKVDTMISVTGDGSMPPKMDPIRQGRINLLLQEWKLRSTP